MNLYADKTGAANTKATLLRLTDTGLTVASPALDIRGRKVLNKGGEELGKVDDLLIDDCEAKVRFLEIASGGFLGLGKTKVLVPVDAISGIRDDAVLINQEPERLSNAPPYQPALTDADYLEDLYKHYGYAPYSLPGYTYPPYPVYPLPGR
jgi:sporulation protein YlmC with PRC-barrel domain